MTSYESTTQPLDPREPLTCVLIQDLLPLYSEGEVSPDSREVIAAHLAECEHCAGFLAGAQSVRAQFQRAQNQRAAAAARERPAAAAASETSLSSRLVQIIGVLVLAALVSLAALNFLRATSLVQLYVTPWTFGLSISSLWLLIGMALLGLVAMLLLRPNRFAPEWKAAISLATVLWGILYLDSLSTGVNGMPLSPFVLFGVLLLLTGGVGLWHARGELLSIKAFALLKRFGGLLVLGAMTFAVLNMLFGHSVSVPISIAVEVPIEAMPTPVP